MFDITQDYTSIDRDVLRRLIATARVSDAVTWDEAEREAEHDVVSLWGGRVSADPPIQVSTGVLIQLVATADAAIRSEPASEAGWARQVERDLVGIGILSGPAGR